MAADERDYNRDPITDEPGAHPVGTGVGATGGAVAGAAAGAIGGPLGMAVGGVVGAVVGGLAGKAAAEAINPTAEEAYWRENYNKEPYYEAGRSFDDYGPAYQHGLSGRTRSEDHWDAAEPRLASEWDNARGGSSLSWPQAKPASRAAWDRVDTTLRSGSSGFGSGSSGFGSGSASMTPAGSNMGTGLSTMDSSMQSASPGANADATSRLGASQDSGPGMNTNQGMKSGTGVGGVTAAVGAMQSAGDNSGDRDDVVDVLQDLVEVCKDGEHGFQSCAEQAQRQDLKSLFQQRAEDCRRGAQQLNDQIRQMGGTVEDSGSALGALHRGWVAVKSTLSTYDDKAVLNEAERGEDNALARYRKALQKPLPPQVKQMVEHQLQGVQRNHDQVKMLRDQARMAS